MQLERASSQPLGLYNPFATETIVCGQLSEHRSRERLNVSAERHAEAVHKELPPPFRPVESREPWEPTVWERVPELRDGIGRGTSWTGRAGVVLFRVSRPELVRFRGGTPTLISIVPLDPELDALALVSDLPVAGSLHLRVGAKFSGELRGPHEVFPLRLGRIDWFAPESKALRSVFDARVSPVHVR